jgi:endonuclease YncB( thermonuclease family)
MRALVALVVGCAVVIAACSGAGTASTTEAQPDEGASTTLTVPENTVRGIVSGVVNGETVEVMIDNELQTVRLTGIRAPQGSDCYAQDASLELSDLTAGRNVALVGDGTDGDGTPMRYLVTDDEVPLLVNMEMVAGGAAVALFGHELQGDFLRANDQAWASGRGMWGTFVCGFTGESVSPDRPQLRIQEIAGPSGTGNGSVVLVNASYTAVDIGGWTLRDAAAIATFTFPQSMPFAAGDTLTLALTCDQQSADLVWCVDGDLWAAGGNTLLLQDTRGNVVDRRVHEVPVTEGQ